MNIAIYVNNIAALGGTERVTCQIANGLQSLGHQVTIISNFQSTPTPFFNLVDSIDRISLQDRELPYYKSMIQRIKFLRRVIKENSFDVIIGSDSQTASILIPASARLKSRIIIWEHFNASIESFLGSRWLGRRIAYCFADDIITLTHQDKLLWKGKFKGKAAVTTIPNPSAYPITNPSHVKPTDPKILLTAGRHTDQKGFDLLVKAWSLLDNKTRENWQLQIVGPNGSNKPRVVELIKSLDLGTSVKLLNSTNDMASLYQSASAYVCSSRYEGFGLTIVEALSHGLPVVSFDCPMGPAEILRDSCGVLAKPNDILNLAEKLQSVLSNDEKLIQLQASSISRAEAFAEKAILQQWQRLLDLG